MTCPNQKKVGENKGTTFSLEKRKKGGGGGVCGLWAGFGLMLQPFTKIINFRTKPTPENKKKEKR